MTDGLDELTEVTVLPDAAPGTVVLGTYRLDEPIAIGGGGMVMRGQHLVLDEPVAIKMLRSGLGSQASIERFMREAQAVSKLRNEHVAKIRDVGTLDGGKPVMVMELLEGRDLDELVRMQGFLSVAFAADLLLQACEALAEAHAMGIIHRDLKPTNLFITHRRDGSPLLKVLDFGVAKAPPGSNGRVELTGTSAVLGTPTYMAPEQMRCARDADARSDIWSLGVVLYELVEGRRPFGDGNFAETCLRVHTEEPGPMIIAPELEPVIRRSLARDVGMRYQTIGEFAADLALYASPGAAHLHVGRIRRMEARALASGTGSAIPMPQAADGSGPVRADITAPIRQLQRPSRATWWYAAAFTAIVAVVTALAVISVRNDARARGNETPPTTSSPAS